MIKLLSKGDLLYLFSQHVKTLIVNVFLFIIGSKTIPIASSQGWCWNTTSPKEGDKDLCRTHKDAKILVLLPLMFFEIIPNKIVVLIALLHVYPNISMHVLDMVLCTLCEVQTKRASFAGYHFLKIGMIL